MNIMAFFAHPDDETMLCGGTLALLAKNGASIDYLCATRGEGGEAGEPPLCTREELGVFRQAELEKAVVALGGKSLTVLDYIDPPVGEGDQLYPYTQDIDQLVREIVQHIQRLKPMAVITHGSNGEYGHPAHLLTHQAARQAVNSLANHSPLLYTVQATFPEHPKPRLANKDDPAHLIIEISDVLDMKINAAMCHRTQHALFVRRGSQQAGRTLAVAETITKIESLHRVSPPVNGRIDDPLVKFLFSTGSILIPGGSR
jgi:LmbE family N-acetylglucosaminyl deacetylase